MEMEQGTEKRKGNRVRAANEWMNGVMDYWLMKKIEMSTLWNETKDEIVSIERKIVKEGEEEEREGEGGGRLSREKRRECHSWRRRRRRETDQMRWLQVIVSWWDKHRSMEEERGTEGTGGRGGGGEGGGGGRVITEREERVIPYGTLDCERREEKNGRIEW